MAFIKVDINEFDFKIIAKKAYTFFDDCNYDISPEVIDHVLKTLIFNVKKVYIEGEWNDCGDVVPPKEYNFHDVLIRRKDQANAYLDTNHTSNIGAYILAVYNSNNSSLFVDRNGASAIGPDEDLRAFEYKFIK